ncbi:unnamed protein product [Spirodela intermedia]|uniref:Uncharacterized protein n=1 Tax=Spirodela intermedia TaxID=51605 RepID=A0A7I8IUK4_SPIIN|nr:unnamed protein product [Spirodela intermedia]CAA6661449.1 unnamed protein product [Spirodela intermedia]
MQDDYRCRHSGPASDYTSSPLSWPAFSAITFRTSCAQLSSVVGGDGTVAPRSTPPGCTAGRAEELEAWHRSFLPSCSRLRRAAAGLLVQQGHERVRCKAHAGGGGDHGGEGRRPRSGPRPGAPSADDAHPDFLRLRPDMWRAANRGEGIIVGMVDTGINPDHVSFEGAKGRRPPWKWRGTASSTAAAPATASSSARGATTRGRRGGAAAAIRCGRRRGLRVCRRDGGGAAPAAHLAIYKAATVAEVLAAINQAIHDRVDVLCLPMASPEGGALISSTAWRSGRWRQCERGSSSSPPQATTGLAGTLRNEAPWIMTVAASTTIGSSPESSIFHDDTDNIFGQLPLVYPTAKRLPAAMAVLRPARRQSSRKIVLCHTGGNISAAEKAKAGLHHRGAPRRRPPHRGRRLQHLAPARRLSRPLLHPTAAVVPGGTPPTRRNGPPPWLGSPRGGRAPSTGGSSSPTCSPRISIVSASHTTKTGFFLDSGTSVAAAHVAGVAAIVNRSNPDWTPAMIRSAIMTTTTLMDRAGDPIADQTGSAANLLATGAGQVDPPRATDPGLVYNIDLGDYVRYLCGLGYTDTQASITAGYSVQCAAVGKVTPEQLNYPSIAARLAASSPADTATVRRTLTNVLQCSTSTYRAKVELPPGVTAKVSPRRLFFWRRGQRRRFTATFSFDNSSAAVIRGDVQGGRLWWYSGTHVVATPSSSPSSNDGHVKVPSHSFVAKT